MGDWNGDGKGDVITRQTDGDVLVLHRGLGNGNFSAAVVLSKGWTHRRPASPPSGDVTGDKHPGPGRQDGKRADDDLPGQRKTGFLAPSHAPASLRTFNQIGSGTLAARSMPGRGSPARTGRSCRSSARPGTEPDRLRLGGRSGRRRRRRPADLVARDGAGTLWLLPGTSKSLGARRLIGTASGPTARRLSAVAQLGRGALVLARAAQVLSRGWRSSTSDPAATSGPRNAADPFGGGRVQVGEQRAPPARRP